MDEWSSPWADQPGDSVALPSGPSLHDDGSLSSGLGPSFGSKLVWQPDLGDNDWGDFGKEDTEVGIDSVAAFDNVTSRQEVTAASDEFPARDPVDSLLGAESSWESAPESFVPPVALPVKTEGVQDGHSNESIDHDLEDSTPTALSIVKDEVTPKATHTASQLDISAAADIYNATPRDSTQRRLIEEQVSQMKIQGLDEFLGEQENETPSMPEIDPISSVDARKLWYRISRSGTLLKHNSGIENYIRVSWAKSQIKKDVTNTVASWQNKGTFDRRSSVAVESRFSAMFGWGPKEESRPSTPGQSSSRGFPSAGITMMSPTPPITPVSSAPRPFPIAAPPALPKVPVPRPSTSTSDIDSAAAVSVAPSRSAYSQDSEQSRRSSQTSLWSSPIAAPVEKPRLSQNEDDTWGDFADVEDSEPGKNDWNWGDITSSVDKHAQTVDTIGDIFGVSAAPPSLSREKATQHTSTFTHMPPTPQSISGAIPSIPISTDVQTHVTFTDFATFVKSLPNLDYMSR